MRENLLDNGIPATISNSAQNFICNQVFYALMHHAKSKNIKAAGLVHIPLLPSQAAEHYKKMQTKTVVQGLPSMHIETITKAVELIIETL